MTKHERYMRKLFQEFEKLIVAGSSQSGPLYKLGIETRLTGMVELICE